jgi:hypothetical protein
MSLPDEVAEDALIAKAFNEMIIAAKAKKAELLAGDVSVARELGRIAATHGFSREECAEYSVRVVQMVLASPTQH